MPVIRLTTAKVPEKRPIASVTLTLHVEFQMQAQDNATICSNYQSDDVCYASLEHITDVMWTQILPVDTWRPVPKTI